MGDDRLKYQKKFLILPMMNIPREQKSISWPGGICSCVPDSMVVLMTETDDEAASYVLSRACLRREANFWVVVVAVATGSSMELL